MADGRTFICEKPNKFRKHVVHDDDDDLSVVRNWYVSLYKTPVLKA